MSPGFAIYDSSKNLIGVVASVASNTSLTLTSNSTATRSAVAFQTEASWMDVKFWTWLKGSASICEWIGNMRLNLKVKDFPETGAVTYPSTFNDTIVKGTNRLGQTFGERLLNHSLYGTAKGTAAAWTKPTV